MKHIICGCKSAALISVGKVISPAEPIPGRFSPTPLPSFPGGGHWGSVGFFWCCTVVCVWMCVHVFILLTTLQHNPQRWLPVRADQNIQRTGDCKVNILKVSRPVSLATLKLCRRQNVLSLSNSDPEKKRRKEGQGTFLDLYSHSGWSVGI